MWPQQDAQPQNEGRQGSPMRQTQPFQFGDVVSHKRVRSEVGDDVDIEDAFPKRFCQTRQDHMTQNGGIQDSPNDVEFSDAFRQRVSKRKAQDEQYFYPNKILKSGSPKSQHNQFAFNFCQNNDVPSNGLGSLHLGDATNYNNGDSSNNDVNMSDEKQSFTNYTKNDDGNTLHGLSLEVNSSFLGHRNSEMEILRESARFLDKLKPSPRPHNWDPSTALVVYKSAEETIKESQDRYSEKEKLKKEFHMKYHLPNCDTSSCFMCANPPSSPKIEVLPDNFQVINEVKDHRNGESTNGGDLMNMEC